MAQSNTAHLRPQSFTIAEFCQRHSICRSSYYALRSEGLAPAEYRIGRAVRITRDAETAWLKQMTEVDPPTPAARDSSKTALKKERTTSKRAPAADDDIADDTTPKRRKKKRSSRMSSSSRPRHSDHTDQLMSKKTTRGDR